MQNGNDFRTNVAQNSPSPRAIVPEAWTTPGEVRTSSDELNSGNNETVFVLRNRMSSFGIWRMDYDRLYYREIK